MADKENERRYQHEYYLRRTKQKRIRERLKRPLVTKVCPVCGKEFTVTYKQARRITCSEECKIIRMKENQKIYRESERGIELRKAYVKTEKFKEGRKKIEQSPKRKAYYKSYWSSEHGIKVRKAYQKTEKYRNYQKEYRRRKKLEQLVDNKNS